MALTGEQFDALFVKAVHAASDEEALALFEDADMDTDTIRELMWRSRNADCFHFTRAEDGKLRATIVHHAVEPELPEYMQKRKKPAPQGRIKRHARRFSWGRFFA